MIRLLLLTLTLAVGLAVPAQADPMTDLRTGNASFKEGKYDDAVQAYTRAIISGQLGAEALAVTFNNRGVAYGELGDFDRAIIDYNEALGLRPDDATSIRNLRVGHVKRGVAEANLGEKDKAVADFTKAIELDPSHFLAYLRRGQLRSEYAEFDLAVADLEKAQNLAPDNPQALELLTKARQMRADSQAAAAATSAAVEPAAPPPGQEPAVAAAAEPTPPSPPAASEPAPSVAAVKPPAAEPARQQRSVASSEPTGDGKRMQLRQAVNMRAGPGNQFERLTTLPGGAVGVVRDEDKGWYELEFASGRRGWIYERWLTPAP
jgi:tetratricopeptide (TPR) repeat protein